MVRVESRKARKGDVRNPGEVPMANSIQTPATTTAARTILRVVIGLLFAAHGWQKYVQFTLEGTVAAFGQMGVPLASVVAPAMATLELVGGIALVLEVFTRIFAGVLTLGMIGAAVLVHAPAGVFVEAGGFELVAALGAGALAIALVGPGRFSIDRTIAELRASKIAGRAAVEV